MPAPASTATPKRSITPQQLPAAESNVLTQATAAGSEVTVGHIGGSQVQGLAPVQEGEGTAESPLAGTPPSKGHEKGARTTQSTVLTPQTAPESSMSPITPKDSRSRRTMNERTIGSKGRSSKAQRTTLHSQIDEEPVNWDEEEQEGQDAEEEYVEREDFDLGDGRTYTGQMMAEGAGVRRRLVPHGNGTLTHGDDCILEGVFNCGEIVEGSQFFANGDRYEGKFLEGRANGHGKLR